MPKLTARESIEAVSYTHRDVYKRQAMNYLKAEVMEMCHSEGLYQIDLLNGSKERITEREYWVFHAFIVLNLQADLFLSEGLDYEMGFHLI